jgi:hypothetical protein
MVAFVFSRALAVWSVQLAILLESIFLQILEILAVQLVRMQAAATKFVLFLPIYHVLRHFKCLFWSNGTLNQ